MVTPDRGLNASWDGLFEVFAERARAAGTEVYRTESGPAAREVLVDIIRELGALSVAVASSPLVDAVDVAGAVEEGGAVVTSGTARQQAEQADLGVSAFDLAIAETGTLGQDATRLDQRLVSMLPPVHLALVPTGRLVATLRDVLGRIGREGEIPGYLAFVSGPSRTADIERVLTIGVHGPERLLVVFVDGEGRGHGEE